MEKLTKQQMNILLSNLYEYNEIIIPTSIYYNNNRVLLKAFNGYGEVFEYFINFNEKYCLKQRLSAVGVHENYEVKSFKF